MNDQPDDWRDRFLERNLREVAGGETPPDLSGRILGRLRTQGPEAQATGAPREIRPSFSASPSGPRMRWLELFGGAAAAAALFTTVLLLARTGDPVRQVSVEVLAGEVIWTGKGGSSLRGVSGTSWSLPLDSGHRLAALGEAAAEARIAAMGVLGMSAGSELEVRKMDWKQFSGGAALGSITVAVIAGAISWNSGNQALTATGGDTVQLKGGAPVEASQPGTSGLREQQRLEKELSSAMTRIKELEAERERRVPVVPERTESAPAGEVKPAPTLVARYTDDQLAEALSAIDWDTMGAAGKELVPLLAELAKRLKENPDDVPLDLAGKIQRWNGELVAQAQELMKHHVPGAGINGAFTHPMVQANLIDAMLAKAGVPLTKDQQEAFGALARSYTEQDRAMRAGFAPETPTLRQYLEEMEMKEKFWGELDRSLAPNQRNAVAPEALRGSMMDVFSSGIVWSQFAKPMEVADRGELVNQMRDQVTRDLGLAAGDAVRVEEIVRGWAQGFGDDYWKGAAGMGKPGGARSDAVRAAARQQVALIDRILATMPLDARQRRKLIGQKTLFVPKLR